MKNAIISALATFIFYADLCEVKIPWTIPVMYLLFWFALISIDDAICEHRATRRRCEKLARQIKKIRRVID